MKTKSYVYRHRRLDTNEIFYIGIGHLPNYERAYQKKYRNDLWHNIVRKTPYSIEILKENLTWKEACELEILLIFEYGRRDLKTGTLVNMTVGGDGAVGRIRTKESIEKFIKSNSGKNHWNYGKTLSKKWKENISKARLSKKIRHSEETRKKMSNDRKGSKGYMYGKKHSKSTKKKISETRINKFNEGYENPFKGKTHSNDTCSKMSKNNKNKKIVMDVETGVFYESASEAAKYCRFSYDALLKYLTGENKNKTNLIYV